MQHKADIHSTISQYKEANKDLFSQLTISNDQYKASLKSVLLLAIVGCVIANMGESHISLTGSACGHSCIQQPPTISDSISKSIKWVILWADWYYGAAILGC